MDASLPKIEGVPLASIIPNPFRGLDEYPYVERKLEALQASIEAVGLWEGVIARRKGDRYELAFGHHRIEAARRLKLKEAGLIVRELTDEQMLQFLGHENMEDYNADFLVMLNTWQATVKFLSLTKDKRTQAVETARFLGWVLVRGEASKRAGETKMNAAAQACNAAHRLIAAGYLTRDELTGLSVDEARNILERTQSRMEHLERLSRPRAEVDAAKTHVAKAAKHVIKESQRGAIAARDLRSQVDMHAYRYASKAQRQTPLFAAFGKALVGQIEAMLKTDSAAEKLKEVVAAMDKINQLEDQDMLQKIDLSVRQLGGRTEEWHKRLIPTSQKITSLKLAAKENGS